jgi:hypothetical protein
LNYSVIRSVQAQANGGADVSGRGRQKGDFLQATEATIKFTVLVEIKRPDTTLLKRPYRSGAWLLNEELVGAVAQVQANCRTWEMEGSISPRNTERLIADRVFTVSPKGILVIGHLAELVDVDRKTTFQLFRRNIINPEIITFDELYERAKFITENNSREERGQRNDRAPKSGAIGSHLPKLREFIKTRRAALAGFMEQGAILQLNGDELAVIPRNDIYVRYLTENRKAIADLASEMFGRKITVEILTAR